jgi:hypothetical protein
VPSANLPQCEFLALQTKNRAFVGGFGSGKTWVGCMGISAHHLLHPRVNAGYFAPTYPLIRDIFYPTIDEVAYDFGMTTQTREGNKEVHFYSGKHQYRGTTICRSMENPGTIVGFKIGHALVDELDLMAQPKGQLAWRKILARMRVNDPTLRNGIDVTTTPEGFKITHKLFVADVQERPELAKNYGIIQASTYDNEGNLPDTYIPGLFEAYTKELVQAYINGQFVNLTSGTVYRNYDRVRCNSGEVIRPGKKDSKEYKDQAEPLFIGMDFNVMHMAATIYVQRLNGWHAVAELKDVFDTPDMVKIIKERWQSKGHRIIVYPDTTAKGRETVDASKSDISLLDQAGFETRYNPGPTPVKDRINATNKQFEIGRLWVNAKACPTTAKCLEGQVYDENGEPDKKSGFDHQNDATSYPMAYEHPIVHDRVERIRVGGH